MGLLKLIVAIPLSSIAYIPFNHEIGGAYRLGNGSKYAFPRNSTRGFCRPVGGEKNMLRFIGVHGLCQRNETSLPRADAAGI